jgi:guanosine-3',5'-bis(diphosphate) 3'-pyrophosphohydrolase
MKIDYGNLDSSTIEFLKVIQNISEDLDFDFIKKAYQFAWHAHKKQRRKSGEPYICHPAAVAIICAEQGMDSTTVVATLLHDVLEDTDIDEKELTEQFGKTVTTLVDGVTKISALQHGGKLEQKVETYRKILLTTAKDIRVVIIKFADRIHNLRTLIYMSDEKKTIIAKETLDVYAPMAHRLGMGNIKTELEDLAFKHLHPEKFDEVVEKTSEGQHLREELLDSFRKPLVEKLKSEKFIADVYGRPKHYYSIFKKNEKRLVPYDEIYDLLALRVICGTREECYRILGIVHNLWSPIPDKLKDYIASPKSNGYQSIHTTVAGPNGNFVEIQIRTWEMNYLAEEGVAAHWRYKGGGEKMEDTSAIKWLRNLVEWQKEFSDSVEFYEFFKIDISGKDITVQTPKMEKILLPIGATVLDFAFAIHSDIGLHCIGAKVNGNVEKPGKALSNGDTVEILHSFDKKPSTEWLYEAKTPRAQFAIKRWLKKVEMKDRVVMGRKLFYQAFNRLHLPSPFSKYRRQVLGHFSVPKEETLFDRIAIASIEISKLTDYIEQLEDGKNRISKSFELDQSDAKVVVDGMDDVMIRYASCCHPLPGDKIIGFLTTGRGISVHRKDCSTAKLFIKDSDRVVRLSWDSENQPINLKSKLEIISENRVGLIQDITKTIENHNLNISKLNLDTVGGHAELSITVEVNSLKQLTGLKDELRELKGVTKVIRLDSSNELES